MTEQDYNSLINNRAFQELDNRLKELNIFNILKIETDELSHSNILGWLLDPFGNHKLVTKFSNLFFTNIIHEIESNITFKNEKKIIIELINYLDIINSHNDCKVIVEKGNKDLRIDIRVDFPFKKIIVAFENKVKSGEHDDQLSRYTEFIKEHYSGYENKLLFFLTIDGNPPVDGKDKNWIPVGYLLVKETIGKLLYSNQYNLNLDTRLILSNYYEILRRNIMEDNKINEELCKKIYDEKRDAIDEIITYISMTRNNIGNTVETLYKELSENGDIVYNKCYSSTKGKRFITNGLGKIFKHDPSRIDIGWSTGYPVMYETRFNTGGIEIFCVVDSNLTKEVSEKVNKIIQYIINNSTCFNKKITKIPKDLKYYHLERWNIDADPDDESYSEDVKSQLNEIITTYIPIFDEKITKIVKEQ